MSVGIGEKLLLALGLSDSHAGKSVSMREKMENRHGVKPVGREVWCSTRCLRQEHAWFLQSRLSWNTRCLRLSSTTKPKLLCQSKDQAKPKTITPRISHGSCFLKAFNVRGLHRDDS